MFYILLSFFRPANISEKRTKKRDINQRFPTAIAKQTHPKTKDTPPIGVIAPITFIPVKARRYKLPENRRIPMIRSNPDLLSHFESI